MPIRSLTARFVATVRTETSLMEIRDTNVRGLTLRVTSKGVKSWALRYRRKSDGRLRLITFGRYPDLSVNAARARALEERARIARGADPAAAVQERKEAPTFAEIAQEWIKVHAQLNKSPRSIRDDQSMLRRHILPAIGNMRAAEVAKRDVVHLLSAVKLKRDARFVKRLPAGHKPVRKKIDFPVLDAMRTLSHRPNRVFELVRAIFRWALKQDILRSDPTAGMDAPIRREKPRERDLTPDEIIVFWRALDNAPLSDGLKLALKLALTTAQRIGEVSGIAVTELDLNHSAPLWTVPSSRSKNGEANRVPLSPLSERLIRAAAALAGDSRWLFPSPRGTGPINPHAATKAMERARPTIGLADFRIHDLRRTAASRMVEAGISPHTISLVLNHISARTGTITGKVYIQYGYDREKRDALNIWGATLEQLVTRCEQPAPSGPVPMLV